MSVMFKSSHVKFFGHVLRGLGHGVVEGTESFQATEAAKAIDKRAVSDAREARLMDLLNGTLPVLLKTPSIVGWMDKVSPNCDEGSPDKVELPREDWAPNSAAGGYPGDGATLTEFARSLWCAYGLLESYIRVINNKPGHGAQVKLLETQIDVLRDAMRDRFDPTTPPDHTPNETVARKALEVCDYWLERDRLNAPDAISGDCDGVPLVFALESLRRHALAIVTRADGYDESKSAGQCLDAPGGFSVADHNGTLSKEFQFLTAISRLDTLVADYQRLYSSHTVVPNHVGELARDFTDLRVGCKTVPVRVSALDALDFCEVWERKTGTPDPKKGCGVFCDKFAEILAAIGVLRDCAKIVLDSSDA